MKSSERQTLRLAILRFIYEHTSGDSRGWVAKESVYGAARQAGASDREVDAAIDYLQQGGWLRWYGTAKFGITRPGVDFVEKHELDAQPGLALANINITTINAPTGSVQVGGSGNTANVQQTVGVPADLAEEFARLRAAVEDLEDGEEATELLVELERQAASESPGKAVVRATGEALVKDLPSHLTATIRAVVAWIIGKVTGAIP
ncbi:MAG: hypothetical protein R3B72_05935 [Polyangiaceae bacterium]